MITRFPCLVFVRIYSPPVIVSASKYILPRLNLIPRVLLDAWLYQSPLQLSPIFPELHAMSDLEDEQEGIPPPTIHNGGTSVFVVLHFYLCGSIRLFLCFYTSVFVVPYVLFCASIRMSLCF